MSRIKFVQMDNLRGLLGIRRMERVPNARIRELPRAMKGVYERIIEGILQWFGNVKRIGNDRNAKRVYVRECAVSHSVGRPRKRCIDTMNECLKKKRFGCQPSKENDT